MSKIGVSSGSLAASTGAVVDELGQLLIGTDTSGGEAQSVGPSLRRELLTGFANGDWSIATSSIGNITEEENPLPFWTRVSTDATAGTLPVEERVTIEVIENDAAASGNELRFTITKDAVNAKEYAISRFTPVAGSRARSFIYEPRAHVIGSTGASAANINAYIRAYYVDTSLTMVGTSWTNSPVLTGIDREIQALPNGGAQLPSDAAFLYVEIGVLINGAITTTETMTVPEARLDVGGIQLLLTDQNAADPTRGGAYVSSGQLYLTADANDGVGADPAVILDTANDRYYMDAKPVAGRGTGPATTTVSGTATLLDLDASSESGVYRSGDTMVAQFAGYYLITARVSFQSSGAGTYRRIFVRNNGTTIATAQDAISTASIAHNINVATQLNLAANDAIDIQGQQNSGGNLTATVLELAVTRLGNSI
jgi:hypothetical protein